MIDLAETNSRMKDFYDVFQLLQSGNIQEDNLNEAIVQTFRRRQTQFIDAHPLFNNTFSSDEKRNQQWLAFLRKTKLNETIDFQEVMQVIKNNLLPIYEKV